MANFLFTPPAAAVAAARVEKATSHLLVGPDWTMNMDICDVINNDQWQAKNVIKAIKKRLQNKNPKVQFLTLTLLEALINNCGDYVHSQVVERDILQEMMKIVRRRTDMQVQDKILELLDFWQEAFGGPGGKYPQYYWAYVELKRSGLVFPRRSRDTPSIFANPSNPALTSTNQQVGYGMPMKTSRRLDEAMASEIGSLSLSDLKHIRSVMELLNDMLQAVNPYDRGAVKDEVITDLVSQCRSNQKKLMQLLSSTGDENLLAQGLELNDSLQNLLAKHDAMASGTLPPEATKSPPKQKMAISHPAASNQFEDDKEDDDDDEFAQLARRNSRLKSVTSESASNYSSDPFSPNRSDWTTTASSTSEASSYAASNALVLLDPSMPVGTRKEPQDMIDLLSLTLTGNPSSPHTPLPTSSTSTQNGSFSATSGGQDYLQNSQPSQMTQGFTPHNSYVAPWAQHALPSGQPQPPLPSQPSQYLSSYSPPWNTGSPGTNPFSSNAYQFVNSYGNPATYSNMPVYTSSPLQRYNSFGSQVPSTTQRTANLKSLQSYNSFSSGVTRLSNSGGETQQNPTLRTLQHHNSFGSGGTTGPTAGAPPTARKPYYHPDSLFDDLIDLRSSSIRQQASSKSSLSGTSGQSMINGGK